MFLLQVYTMNFQKNSPDSPDPCGQVSGLPLAKNVTGPHGTYTKGSYVPWFAAIFAAVVGRDG